ncbi:MAG: sigma-70 family RNA polymerase sigma factor [Candidatus Eisenbacteria bacterium]|uniref:Sigma-70 family RNA polymerase sigma factor n=1 Tax=Eiseniibacteriota bacterium TaxID=2212470 RepID=A0A956RN75_UNCEI|nr:sigma-70 family RNA polymerase sigma factor [Candidatus Eisenbacteria bacterium]
MTRAELASDCLRSSLLRWGEFLDPMTDRPEEPKATGSKPGPVSSNTGVLLDRARHGDARAREALFARYLPILQRWAHQRLPRQSRDLRDTEDFVQDALLKALRRIDSFEHRGEGAFLAYLRQVLLNGIRDEVRRAAVRPDPTTLDDVHSDRSPSMLESMLGREEVEKLERALDRLTEEQKQLLILRVEFGLSYQEVAEAAGKPTSEAARAAVARALVALSKEIRRD